MYVNAKKNVEWYISIMFRWWLSKSMDSYICKLHINNRIYRKKNQHFNFSPFKISLNLLGNQVVICNYVHNKLFFTFHSYSSDDYLKSKLRIHKLHKQTSQKVLRKVSIDIYFFFLLKSIMLRLWLSKSANLSLEFIDCINKWSEVNNVFVCIMYLPKLLKNMHTA